MMTLGHVGDQEAMVYAQLGQQPLARTTETSLQPRQGSLSCLSARPPDLATVTAAQPKVACVRPSIVPFLYSKRTAVTRSPGSRYGRSNVLWPLRANHSWNYPGTYDGLFLAPSVCRGWYGPPKRAYNQNCGARAET